jgi:hypothetical protein
MPGIENVYPNAYQHAQPQDQPPIPDSPELRSSGYGDPLKIAQYFPELI